MTVDHAPDKPPQSVSRSSPLASLGLVAPPGLHGFLFKGGREWGGDLRKVVEKEEKNSALCATKFGGWGGGVVVSMSR